MVAHLSLTAFLREKKEMKTEIHKYFKKGDIVRNEGIWGQRLFVVDGFGGNSYLPELYVYPHGQEKKISNLCNWSVVDTKLINAPKRPLQRIPRKKVVVLMKKGIEEARREFFIRINNKVKF